VEQPLARSHPLLVPVSHCRGAAICKSLKSRDALAGNADNWLANAEFFGTGRPKTGRSKSGRSFEKTFRTQTKPTTNGGGWLRPGRLVRTRAAGSEKSHTGTGEPPRRLPRKL
jgi:hypothetical protein